MGLSSAGRHGGLAEADAFLAGLPPWTALKRKTAMIDWQPIETAPRDGTPLLLWLPAPFSGPAIGHWDQSLICWVDDYRNHETDELLPTHGASLTPPA
jgi:hypothetical protein